MSTSILLSTAYLPPVGYISALINAKKVYIEAQESYRKQTYRNRCVILSANGSLPLVIPVERPKGNHTPISEVVIDYSTGWNRNHWRAIESAYRTSAYFDFIFDVLYPFYHNRYENLFDFNLKLLNALLNFMESQVAIHLTHKYETIPSVSEDLRNAFSPKQKVDSVYVNNIPPYFQVFAHRFGFTTNLSIIDLLFNEGLEARRILKG